MVLTAGLGTRLDPITRLVAKAAVPLGDSTLIEHILAGLARQDVRDVVLNLHHRPATIAAAAGDGSHLGLSVRYSWEQPLLGSAGGPRHALPLLASDPILIINGDTLCDVALAPMLDRHRASGADVTMAVVPNPRPDRYGGFVLGRGDDIVDVLPRGRSEGTWHFVGVQIASRAVFDELADGVPAETVSGIYRARMTHPAGRIRAYRVDAEFLDIGTPEDYLTTALGLRTDAASACRSVIWPDAHVAPDAALAGCIVAGKVSIPAGFRARNRVIVPASVARPDDDAEIAGDLALFPLRASGRL
jgi:NDP-sugar pyrophosphorylase family protein